jgi:hypothetical protein
VTILSEACILKCENGKMRDAEIQALIKTTATLPALQGSILFCIPAY